MKKRVLALILAGTMAMMMVACGTTDLGEVDTNVEADTEADTEVDTDVEADLDADAESEEDLAVGEEVAPLLGVMDILDSIYATADLDEELKAQIESGAFESGEFDSSMASMFLGTSTVEFLSGAASMPMMSSIAYQVVVLQVEEGTDMEAVKADLIDNADTGKWVCVEPEAVVAESNGNFVLFIMADTATADALVAAFQGL